MTTCKPLLTHQGFKLIDFIPADIEKFDNTIATQNHSEKTDRNNLMLTVIKSLILLFLLFCGINVVWAESKLTKAPFTYMPNPLPESLPKGTKDPFAHITNPTPENLPTYSGTCEDLYPITSYNNLITQIYRHLDDDCLYTMSPETLSKKFGIHVGYYKYSNGNGLIVGDVEMNKQPYTGLHSGIYILTDNFPKELEFLSMTVKESREHNYENPYTISMNIYTTDAYSEHNLSPMETLPKQLPMLRNTIRRPTVEMCTYYPNNRKRNKRLRAGRTYWWDGYAASDMRFSYCYAGGGILELAIRKRLFIKE